jgi:hypothetical protein
MNERSQPAQLTTDEDDLQLESTSKPGKHVYFSLDGDRQMYIGIQHGSEHMELYISADSTDRLRDWLLKVPA